MTGFYMQCKTGLKRVKISRTVMTKDGNTSSNKMTLNVHKIKINSRNKDFERILQQHQEFQEQNSIKEKTVKK